MMFPVLTCVDRYLAVVHAITYLRLRRTHGVTIRNIATVTVWVFCFGGLTVWFFLRNSPHAFIPSVFSVVMLLSIMIFCSLSVLCVLIRPRPGEVGVDRMQVDKLKQRAFYTILIIMGVLSLRFGGTLASSMIFSSPTVSYYVKYMMVTSTALFNLPSSLVLPLLFLHRAGKLPGCKHNTESG